MPLTELRRLNGDEAYAGYYGLRAIQRAQTGAPVETHARLAASYAFRARPDLRDEPQAAREDTGGARR